MPTLDSKRELDARCSMVSIGPKAPVRLISADGGIVPHVGHSPLENAARCTNGGNAKAAARHRAYRPAAA
jgi:hypothetical protein